MEEKDLGMERIGGTIGRQGERYSHLFCNTDE
jgi:hypothetical protein